MKKILVLMLVLGLISVANAGVFSGELKVGGASIGDSIDVVKNNLLTIQISANNANTWSGYIVILDGDDGALSNPYVDLTKAGDFGAYAAYAEVDWGNGYSVIADYVSVAPTAGIQFTFDIVTTALSIGDSGKIGLFDDTVGWNWNQHERDWTVFHVVPEPMTLVLLGLGGLFLRRRR